MAVLSVQEIFEGRGGATGDEDSDTRAFRVITDNGFNNRYIILNSGLVPTRGSSHNTQSNLICKKVDCQQDRSVKSPRHWIVTAFYDNKPLGQLPSLAQSAQPHPLLRPVEIEGKGVIGKKARTLGRLIATKRLNEWSGGAGQTIPENLSPMENTAHEAFEGLEEDDIQWQIEVTINDTAIPLWVADYQGAINKEPVTIRGYAKPFPRWSLKVGVLTHSKPLDETLPSGVIVTYIQSKFSLHYKKDLWVTPVRNDGYMKLVGNERTVPINLRGAKPTAKVLLNDDGTVMANPAAESAIYRFYADGPAVDFSVFKLA